jgi:GT2 family glycosyltransferase
MKIKIIIGTRYSEKDFYDRSATGKSLKLFTPSFVEINLFPQNTLGLSEIYNKVIYIPDHDETIMVFIHDDVHILDYFWFYRVQEALSNFEIIGIVGNKTRHFQQPSWAFKNSEMMIDDYSNFSGVIAHGKEIPPRKIDFFGQTRQKVKLIDGVFIATKRKTLINNSLFFDEQFSFDFYDLDFCRQAEIKGINIGTWDIALMHESGGNYCNPKWIESYKKYLSKWKDYDEK